MIYRFNVNKNRLIDWAKELVPMPKELFGRWGRNGCWRWRLVHHVQWWDDKYSYMCNEFIYIVDFVHGSIHHRYRMIRNSRETNPSVSFARGMELKMKDFIVENVPINGKEWWLRSTPKKI